MTKEGKCDVCRKRKIKCDEAHPTCRACETGNRKCTYYFGKVKEGFIQCSPIRPGIVSTLTMEHDVSDGADFATDHKSTAVAKLELRSTTKAVSGQSTFQTFSVRGTTRMYGVVGRRAARGRQQLPNEKTWLPALISPPPLSPTQAVLKRWYSFMQVANPGNPNPGVFGWWLEELPLFLNNSPAIESALKTLLDFAVCRVTPTAANVAEALRENNRALGKIRTVIVGGDAERIQNEVLMAIILLNFAEFVYGNTSDVSMVHARGLISLMQKMTDGGKRCSQRCRKVLYGITGSAENVSKSIPASGLLEGRDHPFDNDIWINIPIPEMPGETMAGIKATKTYQMKRNIQFPRLVRLVREARKAPFDEVARQKAADLASELYFPSLDPWVVQLIDLGWAHKRLTEDPAVEKYTPYSFHFKEDRVCKELTLYWQTRSAVCGAVLGLCAISPPMSCTTNIFNAADVIAEDLQVAQSLAMCVQHAMASLSSPLPIQAMNFMSPLSTSFGAWHRLEKRTEKPLTSGDEADRARRMKLWICDITDTICRKCNMPATPKHFREETSEIYMGGFLTV